MNEDNQFCFFHPTEAVIGVCSLCLCERLIVLASKQGHHLPRAKSNNFIRNQSFSHHYKAPTSLPKIFAIGSLLNRFEFRHRKSQDFNSRSSTSHEDEDSFISIKFEDNIGVASWEKAAAASTVSSKVSLEHCNFSWSHSSARNESKESTKSVVEHVKHRGSMLRWRKRIGHLFQLSRWKRSNKGSVCHVGSKMEGVKVRNNGWIRSLTKRRTKE